jgi:hypothetical protein
MTRAAAGDVRAGIWQVRPPVPLLCFRILQVDVDRDELDAGRNADQRIRPGAPVFAHKIGIDRTILKSVRG